MLNKTLGNAEEGCIQESKTVPARPWMYNASSIMELTTFWVVASQLELKLQASLKAAKEKKTPTELHAAQKE
jgi:hypothetical protein